MRLPNTFAIPFLLLCAATNVNAAEKSLGRPLRVAVVLDFTGKMLATEEVMDGLNEAIKVAQSNSKLEVSLSTFDSHTDGAGTVLAMQKALASGPDLVIAEIFSSKALLAAELAEEAGRIMITPLATAPVVTAGRRFVFRACFSDAFLASRLAEFAWTDLGAQSMALMVDSGQTYSQQFAESFSKRYRELGGKIVADERFIDSTVDFAPALGRIAAAKPQAVLLPVYNTPAARVLSQAAKLGYSALRWLGGDGWAPTTVFHELVMDPHLGLDAFWVSHTAMKPITKVMQDFDAQFRLHQGHPPGSRAPLGYDSLMLYIEALRSTGWDPTPVKIADALRALRPYQGTSGLISFNGGQDPAKSVFIQHLTDKGDETFREIKP